MSKNVKIHRWKVFVNEGAFLYEPWLCNGVKEYRYDKIPVKVMMELIEQRKLAEKCGAGEARLVFDFALRQAELSIGRNHAKRNRRK